MIIIDTNYLYVGKPNYFRYSISHHLSNTMWSSMNHYKTKQEVLAQIQVLSDDNKLDLESYLEFLKFKDNNE